MKRKIIIVSEEHRARAVAIINSLPLDPVQEIIIRERKKDRSADQNSLYWKWLTIIGNELGEGKEDLHERYKDKFLVQVYERDNDEYAGMIQALRNVYQHGLRQEALSLRRKIVSLTSTTTATVKQMAEYLQNIERDAATLAIRLPTMEEQ